MRRAAMIVLTVLVSTRAAVPSVRAQVVEVPTFAVGASDGAYPSVAAGLDGTAVFLWSESVGSDRAAFTRRFDATGTPLGAKQRIDDSGRVYRTGISATPTGGYVASWHYQSPQLYTAIYGQALSALGSVVGKSYAVGSPALIGGSVNVAGLPSGSVFFWTKNTTAYLRLFRENGAPYSNEIEVGTGWTFSDVAALPGGGFVIVWWGFSDGFNYARVYDAAGIPLGPEPFVVSEEFIPTRVAAGLADGFVVAGRGTSAGTAPGAAWFRRFTSAGDPVGPPVIVAPTRFGDVQDPDIALDEQGNVYVAWTTHNNEGALELPPRARGFGPDDQPFGPAIDLNVDTGGSDLRVAHLPNGGFVNTWNYFGIIYGNVASLCTPGAATCGDGVVNPQCEQCDDGADNSDTASDACRTDCTRPRCRDGVVDTAEACDDGNPESCDGCSLQCESEPGLACGDGVTNATCAQYCDDANATAGDGCTATCELERIPGGGSAKTDCLIAWQVNNPANVPLLDKRGAINQEQQCVDDDPRCDFDGGTTGECTFLVRACGNNTDVAGCNPGTRLASWTLTSPTAKKAAVDPALAAIRAAFTGSVPAAIVGPTDIDLCSGDVTVRVPLRPRGSRIAAGKLKLAATATLYDGRRDKDTLRLTCLPAVP